MAKKRGSGEGTIIKKANGSWMSVATIGKNDQGKQKRQYFYGKTKSEVSEKLNKLKSEITAGTYIVPNKSTLGIIKKITSQLRN